MEPNKELPPVDNSDKLLESGHSSEHLIINPENVANSAGSKPPQSSTPVTATPSQLPQQAPYQVQQNTNLPDDNSLIADDTDLIEKEWVNKAKQIVEQTKHDPHLQTNEMSKFKAEYQKKRYNKDVKVSNG